MNYQQGGGKYPIHVSRGSCASREEKIGRNAFVQWGAFIHAFGSSFSPEF
jgi:hypothetical protein